MVRDGVCGTPLIYIGRDERGEEGVLARGIVGGFMLYCDNGVSKGCSALAQTLLSSTSSPTCNSSDELIYSNLIAITNIEIPPARPPTTQDDRTELANRLQTLPQFAAT
jgi:hypothetical protein